MLFKGNFEGRTQGGKTYYLFGLKRNEILVLREGLRKILNSYQFKKEFKNGPSRMIMKQIKLDLDDFIRKDFKRCRHEDIKT